jgi:hypothetical protein
VFLHTGMAISTGLAFQTASRYVFAAAHLFPLRGTASTNTIITAIMIEAAITLTVTATTSAGRLKPAVVPGAILTTAPEAAAAAAALVTETEIGTETGT